MGHQKGWPRTGPRGVRPSAMRRVREFVHAKKSFLEDLPLLAQPRTTWESTQHSTRCRRAPWLASMRSSDTRCSRALMWSRERKRQAKSSVHDAGVMRAAAEL